MTIVFLVSKIFDDQWIVWSCIVHGRFALSRRLCRFQIVFPSDFQRFFYLSIMFTFYEPIFVDFYWFSWTNHGKRRPEREFLAKKRANYREMTVECPRNSFKNQQNWLTVMLYSEILDLLTNTRPWEALKIWRNPSVWYTDSISLLSWPLYLR